MRTVADVIDLKKNEDTMLTKFFDLNTSLNEKDADARRPHLYQDIPLYYVWNNRYKRWQTAKHRPGKPKVTRLMPAYPGQSERYYLRLLLLSVLGPRSFKLLRSYQGQVSHAFQQAYCVWGLLIDSDTWMNTMLGGDFRCVKEKLYFITTHKH